MGRLLRAAWVALWDLQETIAIGVRRLEHVGPKEGAVFSVRAMTYRGREVVLGDGTRVVDGQPFGELHLRNATLRSLHGQAERPRQVGFLFREALLRGLRDLARLAEEDPRYSSLPAFGGVTMLHYGAGKLGFETRELPEGLRTKLVSLYQAVLTARHHPSGWVRVGQGTRTRSSKEIWISRRRLLALYGSESQQRRQRDEAEAGVAQPGDDEG
jgi:hypothetical protein